MRWGVFLFVLAAVSAAPAQISTRVCEADGKTPFDGRDIMVGTKLTIIVSSDAAVYWNGALAITGLDREYGLLSARDFNGMDYEGSRFPEAGEFAAVWDLVEQGVQGFQFAGDFGAVPGDWFIIDYNATAEGICNVGFYDHDVDFYTPVYYLVFTQVPTRDFDDDGGVNFADYAVLGSQWKAADCDQANGWCAGADLDGDGSVDGWDLALFTDYWLESDQP